MGVDQARKYVELVEHDIKLLDLLTGSLPKHLSDEDFSDWQVTNLFYIACMLLKSVCALSGLQIQNHYNLRNIINTKPELIGIARDYRHLEEASRDARYEGRLFTRVYIVDRLIPKFNSVKECAVFLLNQEGVEVVSDFDVKSLLARQSN